ncbi:MAG: DUF2268 domain-containing putative Zn-dependent protease [Bacteroidota bacterium]
MKKILLFPFLILSIWTITFGQDRVMTAFPEQGEFITSDLERFWEAVENMDTEPKSFEAYLAQGSIGLKSFIPGRIINADSLSSKVRERKNDYLPFKDFHFEREELVSHYHSLKKLYPYAQFPPVYFVMGRFSSGGTSNDVGLIIGVEMLTDVDLSFLVIHECIHFQQNRSKRDHSLLEKSIIEGSADFIAELITGSLGNQKMYDYCEANEELILQQFSKEMLKNDYGDWLYNTDLESRPANMGYWVGYKICESIYHKAKDKKLAINRMLNNTDYLSLLSESEILEKYMRPMVIGLQPFANHSNNVDFNLTELEIGFSHPMQGSSFRPIREEGVLFPLEDIIGYDETHTKFSLTIKLEPNTEYAFIVSGRGFRNEFAYPIEEYEVRFTTKKE